MTPITMTEGYYKRTVQALKETEAFLLKHPSSDLAEFNKKHAIALRTILTEIHVVDRQTTDEAMASVTAMCDRLKQIKAAI